VAREVGVSRTLVSFAFRGVPGVGDDTKRAIFEAAERLGYRHNVVAADLASKRPSTIGLYLLDFRNEVYAEIFRGVRDALNPARNRLILAVSDADEPADDNAVDSLVDARVGVIIAATLFLPDDRVRALSRTVPVVNVARQIDGMDSVYADNVAGARIATQHLLDLGHRRIAHLTGPEHEGHLQRRQAYAEVMRAAGLTPQVVIAPGYSQDAAERAARAMLDVADRPTAVFAHNDQIALGAREAAHALGLRVPDDLSLVGYDNSRITRLHGIDLTSIDQDARGLGREAGVAALVRLRDPDAPPADRNRQPSLVVRGSTAPCPDDRG